MFGSNAVKDVGSVIDGLTTSNDEKSAAKQKLSQTVLTALNDATRAQADIIQTEMKGNWLQRSWRPLTMLAFVVLLIIRWTGLSDHKIDLQLEIQLMELIKLGLGGYVVGRSVEKIAGTVTQNIDLPFLKKKDRK